MSGVAEPAGRRPPFWLLLAVYFLPGLLAGTQLAGLVLFLNPDLPFSLGLLARGALFYGGLLGAVSTTVLAPLSWRLGSRAFRPLPWAVTFALAMSALTYWASASRYSYFVPPGIDVRMIKAALWLTLSSLICFYIALLHSQQHRRHGMQSRVGFVLLALASVYVVAERREAFKPRPAPVPLPSTVETQQRPTLLVVGLDGATLDAVLPLARQGRLPFFGRLIEQGTYARARSFPPTESAALWTTLATGKWPYKHGVVSRSVYPADFLGPGTMLQLLPAGLGFARWGTPGASRSIDSGARKSPALWQILDRLGVPTGLVGWPVTDPVPPGAGFAFSDNYFYGEFSAGSARPVELAERGLLFHVAAEEIDPALVAELGERPPYSVLNALAGDLWRGSLTQFLLEQRDDVRAIFLRLPGLDRVSRGYFGGYAAAQFDGAQQRRPQEAALFLTGYYRYLDRFIERLWERQPAPRILAIVSPHGYEAPAGLDKLWALVRGRRLEGHASGPPDGVLLFAGDGIRAGSFLDRAELVDVMPTLLYALGLPIARDLDGRVLTSAFDSAFLARHPLTFVPSYDTLATEPDELETEAIPEEPEDAGEVDPAPGAPPARP